MDHWGTKRSEMMRVANNHTIKSDQQWRCITAVHGRQT
jgi:hypothetical protein